MKDIKTIVAKQLDENQVAFLVSMINKVYQESESDIWKVGHERIALLRMIEIIAKGELLLAVTDSEICGCIHLEPMDDVMAKFKMLVANPKFKGQGVGSMLINYAEEVARVNGANKMQLELLVPTDFEQPDKIFLNSWYTRIGYQKTEEHDVEYLNPGLSKLLKTGCVAEIYHKYI